MYSVFVIRYTAINAAIVFCFPRQGGGMGSGDIRKMAYYEQSIDPVNVKVRCDNRWKVV